MFWNSVSRGSCLNAMFIFIFTFFGTTHTFAGDVAIAIPSTKAQIHGVLTTPLNDKSFDFVVYDGGMLKVSKEGKDKTSGIILTLAKGPEGATPAVRMIEIEIAEHPSGGGEKVVFIDDPETEDPTKKTIINGTLQTSDDYMIEIKAVDLGGLEKSFLPDSFLVGRHKLPEEVYNSTCCIECGGITVCGCSVAGCGATCCSGSCCNDFGTPDERY